MKTTGVCLRRPASRVSALMIHVSSIYILITAAFSCVTLLAGVKISGAPQSRLALHKSACLIARVAPALLVYHSSFLTQTIFRRSGTI